MRVSPRARKLAEREGVALGTLVGTGPGGRISEEDVSRAIETLGPRISVREARLAYHYAAGPEPAVLFLAGFGFERTAFNVQLVELGGWRRLIAADPRGTGRSTMPADEPVDSKRSVSSMAFGIRPGS